MSLAKLIQPFSTLLFFNKPSERFRFATEGKAESLRTTRKLSFSHHMTEDKGPENKWKRETAFLCTADFNNNLPPNPIRWKLMDFPTHRACLALPGAEALHDELSQRNTLSADLGESVDPVLLKSYKSALAVHLFYPRTPHFSTSTPIHIARQPVMTSTCHRRDDLISQRLYGP